MQSVGKLEVPTLKQWVSQASGWVPVMLRCLSQVSLSHEWNFTSCWLVAHSRDVYVWFLSLEILFCTLSFQCSCFQQLSGLNNLLTTSSESHVLYIVSECGLWACSLQQAAPPAFLRHLLDWLLLQSRIYCLSLPICPIRNKPWVRFAQLFVWTCDPMCSSQDKVEKPPFSPWSSNTSGLSLLA